ncbi:MAG: 2-dehydropantoate 2-reductase [Deltaproteobacteria bacterium]|jgi:2-dehydropantoate 2-reductase|nr:2-dehydropantoate 2-reductase [Deltaproteobacteria bacterium]
MKIAILGAGAMGSLCGAFLAGQSENQITLINRRKDHVEAINQRGLIVKSSQGPDLVIKNLKAVTSADLVGEQELVIVSVKATGTKEAIDQSLNLVGPATMVLTLQNGLGNIETLCQAVNPSQVLGGANSYGSWFYKPGEVILAGRGEIVIGQLDDRDGQRLMNLKGLFERSSINVKTTTNLKGIIWTKLISNIGINALCAILGIKNGLLIKKPESEALMTQAVNEAAAVAKAEGVTLETDDPVAYAKKVCQNSAENICSMLQDVRAKKQTEISAINGAIVNLGKKHQIPTPINGVLTDLVKSIQQNY